MFVALSSAALLTACEQMQPARVCAAEETVETVRALLLQHLIGDSSGVDLELVQRAFDDTVALDLIRYEGRDKETNTIRCRASVKSTRAEGSAQLKYTRQPDVGKGGYVYAIDVPSSSVWYAVAQGVADRYRALEIGPPVDAEFNAPESPNTPTFEPDRAALEPSAPASDRTSEALEATAPSHPAPPAQTPEPPQKFERVEYVGPPRINPGPPPPPAPSRLALPSEITNPQWARRPSAAFPPAAADAGVAEGRVSMECRAQPNGAVTACRVLSESPPGLGFADAALDASRRATLAPRTVDSAATGAKVTFTVIVRPPL